MHQNECSSHRVSPYFDPELSIENSFFFFFYLFLELFMLELEWGLQMEKK